MKSICHNIEIKGISASIPEDTHSYLDNPSPFSMEEAIKLSEATGVKERRILPPHLCASDMCCHAAEALIEDLTWDPNTISLLIFVSQDSDYVLPATACILQDKLKLPQECAAFDVNLGCSGFIYALWMASKLLQGGDGHRALILCGDTSSRFLRADDRSTLPLFGDAGCAVAIERNDTLQQDMHIITGTDGRGAANILVKAGGRRYPLVPPYDGLTKEQAETLAHEGRLELKGAEVFSFSLLKVPKLVKSILSYSGNTIEDIDYCIMHQANTFMLKHLQKKTKFPDEKFIIDMAQYGNTSSASIPLAMASTLANTLNHKKVRCLLTGFGVGWSWGALTADIGPIHKPLLNEIPNSYPPLTIT